MSAPSCPLCASANTRQYANVRERIYFECDRCRLVHLSAAQRLDATAEREYYRTHRNDPADERYRAYLSRLTVPLLARLTLGMCGLDYGCGPGPTLSLMLQDAGMHMSIFDPFFAPTPAVLRRTYDFIACSEVAEHLHSPRTEVERLDGMLRPGGWLGVMTSLLLDERGFAQWHYIRDPTHVCFYRPQTMQWLARWRNWTLELDPPNVALFQKAPG